MDLTSVENYATAHTSEDSPLIKELVKTSEQELEHIDMISGPLVARLLATLVKISGAQRILEVGTFTGYSALTMAEALPEGGELITCEYNERYEDIARTFFERSDHRDKISLVMGPALTTIPELEGDFDFVFLDADKINYPNYYKLILPRLKTGGIMVIDNILWGGEVLHPKSDKAKAINRLSTLIDGDQTVEQVMLTVRDGLTLLYKK